MKASSSNSLILGNLVDRCILDKEDQFISPHPSGDPLFAAAASKSLGIYPTLLSRISLDYPQAYITDIQTRGINISAIQRLERSYDHRLFTSLKDPQRPHHDKPIQHFAQARQKLPKSLLDYQYNDTHIDKPDKRKKMTWRESDLNGIQTVFAGAHLCPNDFLSHQLMPSALRARGIKTLTLESRHSYMIPDFKRKIPDLVNGLSAFVSTRQQIEQVFGKGIDHWQEMARLADFGCDAIILVDHFKGIDLFIADKLQRLHIPPYPGKIRDLTFAKSSFGGGLLAGLILTQDILEAALLGAAAMSLAAESYKPFFILDSYEGLITSRKDNLAQAIKTR